jgi:enoyl-CoA hydratase
MSYQNIQVEAFGKVGIVRIDRPAQLNALNAETKGEIIDALEAFDCHSGIGCMVLTGDDRAFAAGADIKQMADATVVDVLDQDKSSVSDRLRHIRKPIVAAVSGWALGGGCELAMACDMIVASNTAIFGQPEIKLGVIPGAGGTQRLTRVVGKAIAMEMVLNARFLSATEAFGLGLVSRVVSPETYLDEAVTLARQIADRPPIAVRLAKEAINAAYETSLSEGLLHERRNFTLLFSTEDQKEGMHAFLEKRSAAWHGK